MEARGNTAVFHALAMSISCQAKSGCEALANELPDLQLVVRPAQCEAHENQIPDWSTLCFSLDVART